MVDEQKKVQLEFEDVPVDQLFQPVSEQARFWEPDKYVFITRSIRRVKQTNPKYAGNQNLWTFDVYSATGEHVKRFEDGNPAQLSQFISDKMTPQSRGRPLIEAIVGRKLSDDEPIDINKDVIGRPFVGFIQYEVPKNSEDGKQKPYLRSPMPFPRGKQFTPEAAEAKPAPREVVEEVDELPF